MCLYHFMYVIMITSTDRIILKISELRHTTLLVEPWDHDPITDTKESPSLFTVSRLAVLATQLPIY